MEKFYLFILFFTFVLFNGVRAAPSESDSLSSGQERLEHLEAEISHLNSEVGALIKTVKTLEGTMITNIADQYADKTILSIMVNNQNEATKFWLQMLNHAKQIRPDDLLTKIVQKSYSGTRTNFYPLLEFIIKNNISTAFPLLYAELESHGHIYDGQEIFVLANYLKATCGPNTKLFRSLPKVVQNIVSGPVIFQNAENKGYIIASQHQPCKDKTECYGNPKNEALLYRIFSHSSSIPSELIQNPRSHWHFIPPITMDMKRGFNGTRMAWGFHIKNVAEDRYLITKMRLTSFFLRDNTSFDSYYVRDMQCQYMPTLINVDGKGSDNKILIGLKEKHVYKMEYIYGNKFYKNDNKTPLQLRKQGHLLGNIWEVIPVGSTDESDANKIEVDDNASGVDVNVSDSKCQF